MKNDNVEKQKLIEQIGSSIDTLGLSYQSVVIQDIKNGTFNTNNKYIDEVKLYFSKLGIDFSLLKAPRREDDAIIFLLEASGNKLCLKMLPDVWIATAEHTRHKGYLVKMLKSKYLPNIHFSKLDTINESILYVYDYIEGVPLSKIVSTTTADQKKEILKTLASCVNDWVLNYNLDVNFEALDDFVIDPSNFSNIYLTDINMAFQASEMLGPKDLLRIVKRRALRSFSEKGFERIDVYNALYETKESNA